MQQVGDDRGGQQRAPARLYQRHAQALAPALLDAHLGDRREWWDWASEAMLVGCGAGGHKAHLPAVFAVGEVVQVPVVQVAGPWGALVLLGCHLAGVQAAVPQELAIGHGKGLPNGLGDQSSLEARRGYVLGGAQLELIPRG